jgi:GDP-L-fucose synthase
MLKDSSIFVACHRGLVGSALVRTLQYQGFSNIITRTHSEMDLENQAAVEEFFKANNRNMYSFLQLKLEGSMQITPIRQNSRTVICRFSAILSIVHTNTK